MFGHQVVLWLQVMSGDEGANHHAGHEFPHHRPGLLLPQLLPLLLQQGLLGRGQYTQIPVSGVK